MPTHTPRAVIELPTPDLTPPEYADGSRQWEHGWISARQGEGTVTVADDTVPAATARRWAACLLAAADCAQSAVRPNC